MKKILSILIVVVVIVGAYFLLNKNQEPQLDELIRIGLLNEPSLGLAPKIVKEVFQKIKEINEKTKMAIVVVEHNIKSLLEIAQRAYVLDKGKVVVVDTPSNIINSNILEKVFLSHVK